MNFKEWSKKRHGEGNHPAVDTARYLTKKGWIGCRQQVLKLLDNPKLDNNSDLKFLKEEIKKL